MKSKKELKNEYKQLKIQGKKNLSITYLDFTTFKKELNDNEEIIALTTRPTIRKAYRVCITKKRILIRPAGIVYEKPNYDIDFKEIYKDSINYKNATVITFETDIEKIEVYDNKSSFFDFLKEKQRTTLRKNLLKMWIMKKKLNMRKKMTEIKSDLYKVYVSGRRYHWKMSLV